MAEETDFDNFEAEVTYVDSALRDKLIVAMIDAYMLREYPYITGGSCSEGRFEYRNAGNRYSGYYHYNVSYPGGHWTSNQTGDPVSNALTTDVRTEVYQAIEDQVNEILSPLMRAPKPEDFDHQIQVLQKVTEQLSVSGEVRTTGNGPATVVEFGNQLVPHYIQAIDDDLGDLNGVAVKRLRAVYGAERIADVMTGLHALATVAGVLVAGEKQAWARFHRDFYKLIRDGAADFHAFSRGNGVSAAEIFDVLKSVADASSLLSLPAATGKAIARATTISGIIEGWLPKPPAPHKYRLDGSSYSTLSETFWTALSDLVEDLDSTEVAFSDCAYNAVTAATDPKGVVKTAFDLKNPTEFLEADERGIYYTRGGQPDDEIAIDDALLAVSGRYEAIGDHCRAVAKMILSAPERDPWAREFVGPHGLAYGHFENFDGLIQVLAALLIGNSREMHSVGEKCLLILRDFFDTDNVSKTTLKQIHKQLDAEAAAVVRLAKKDVV